MFLVLLELNFQTVLDYCVTNVFNNHEEGWRISKNQRQDRLLQ